MPVFWWMRLDLVFLVGRSTSGGVFWGVCSLIMILGIIKRIVLHWRNINGLLMDCVVFLSC